MSTAENAPLRTRIIDRVTDYFARQEPPTVILAAILGVLCYGAIIGVPAYMNRQDKEREEMRRAHEAERTQTRDDFRESLRQQREDFLGTLKEFKEARK